MVCDAPPFPSRQAYATHMLRCRRHMSRVEAAWCVAWIAMLFAAVPLGMANEKSARWWLIGTIVAIFVAPPAFIIWWCKRYERRQRLRCASCQSVLYSGMVLEFTTMTGKCVGCGSTLFPAESEGIDPSLN